MVSYLNEIEIAEVEKFLENSTLVEAVKKVMLSGLYAQGVLVPGQKADLTRNFALGEVVTAMNNGIALPNEQLGQTLRGKAEGLSLVEQAFRDLEKMRKVVPAEPKKKAIK
jgi:hypothetical protein